MSWEKIITWVVGGILALWLALTVLGGVGFKFDPFNTMENKLDQATLDAALAKGEAVKSAAQSGVDSDKAAIAARAAKREVNIGDTRNENNTEIKKAAGSDVVLSPDLINATNNSLCKYESTPGCSGD